MDGTGLSVALKRVLQHSRPLTCASLGNCHKFGMPSSHAQVMAFASSTALLVHLHRRRLRSKSQKHRGQLSHPFEILEIVALFTISVLDACSRVYLGYHTTIQVSVGFVVGGLHSMAWVWVLSMLDHSGALHKLASLLVGLGFHNSWKSSRMNEYTKIETLLEKKGT